MTKGFASKCKLITREHVIKAIKEIKEKTTRQKIHASKGYDLIYEDEAYPPKPVLSVAYKIATGKELPVKTFHGGPATNSKLQALDFIVWSKLGSKFDNDELKKLIEKAKKMGRENPKTSKIVTNTINRNEHIRHLTKLLTEGKCDLCKKEGPFTHNNQKYLECHHIVHLANGGPDTLENTVALCPNCHRKMHILDVKTDIKKLEKVNIEK